MTDGVPSRSASRGRGVVLSFLAAAALLLATAGLADAQIHGVPPSVTSIQFHVPPFLPNIMPSVTSLGPNGYGYARGPIPRPYGINRPVYGHGRRNGSGFSGYGGYVVPYFVPVFDSSYGSDPGDAGPYLYSAPPADQTPHIVVDTQPAKRDAAADDDSDSLPPPVTAQSKHERDAGPLDSTVLVFRDGHQQEVSNYAIMGQTVYVFDMRTQKIALGDLDVPATIKANDDRGVEFQLPDPKPS